METWVYNPEILMGNGALDPLSLLCGIYWHFCFVCGMTEYGLLNEAGELE